MSEFSELSKTVPKGASSEVANLLHNDASLSPAAWLKTNVVNPAINAGIVEGVNALANVVNSGTRTLAGSDVLPKLEHLEVQQAKFLSTEWLAQNVSSGMAMVVPYLLASKATGMSLRGAGSALGIEGTAAKVLQHRATASILGAATFDYLRDTRPNETHAGNAIAGAAAFSVFEIGNTFSGGLNKAPLILARAATGAAGALTQLTLSRQIATGELPGKEEYLQAAITGGIMNNVLPPLHAKLTEVGDQINLATGRGIAIDRFRGQSKLLDEVIDHNSWARVKSGGKQIEFDLSKVNFSAERLRSELGGIFQAEKPSVGLDALMQTGLMKKIIPELVELNGPKGQQDAKWHPEGNAWRHTLLVVDNLAKAGNGSQFDLMFTGLVHDVGKPATQKIWPDGGISNYKHDSVGAEMTAPITARLPMSNAERQSVYELTLMHMKMHEVRKVRHNNPEESQPGKLWQILSRPDIHKLIELQHADALGTTFPGRFERSNRAFLLSKIEEMKNTTATQ